MRILFDEKVDQFVALLERLKEVGIPFLTSGQDEYRNAYKVFFLAFNLTAYNVKRLKGTLSVRQEHNISQIQTQIESICSDWGVAVNFGKTAHDFSTYLILPTGASNSPHGWGIG